MSTPPLSIRPSSIGAKPRSVHSAATRALAAGSLLDTKTTRLPNSGGRFSASCLAAVWLNDLTTAAPGKASALNSVDRRPPRIFSELGTRNAFVVSMTILPDQSARRRPTSRTCKNGMARMITSASRAVSRVTGVIEADSSVTSIVSGPRVLAKSAGTWWSENRCARTEPMLPVPTTAYCTALVIARPPRSERPR